jgi:hypothetical protein
VPALESTSAPAGSAELTRLARQLEAAALERHRHDGDLIARRSVTTVDDWEPVVASRLREGPEGLRLLAHVVSGDYLRAVGAPGGGLTVEELADLADADGLAIEAISPYGALLGGPDSTASLLADLENTNRWRRLLGWIEGDATLASAVRVLERTLIAALPPGVTHRMLVVLARRSAATANAGWRDRSRTVSRSLATGDLEGAVPGLATIAQTLATELAPLLTSSKVRYLCFSILNAAASRLPGLDATRFLPADVAATYAAWRRAGLIDAEATALTRTWAASSPMRLHHGVDVTLACDYPLVRDLLAQHYGLFGDEH